MQGTLEIRIGSIDSEAIFQDLEEHGGSSGTFKRLMAPSIEKWYGFHAMPSVDDVVFVFCWWSRGEPGGNR